MKLLPSFRKNSKTQNNQRRVNLAESYKGVKVSSYYTATKRSGNELDTAKRGAARTPKPRLVRGILAKVGLYGVIVAIVVISIVYSLLLSTEPITSQSRYSAGNTSASYFTSERYTAAVAHELKASILNRTKMTLRTADIEQALMKQFPDIAAASVQVDVLGAKPRVIIKTYEPVFTLSQRGKTYMVLEDGSLIQGPSLAGLTNIDDVSGVLVSDGMKYLRQDDTQFLSYVKSELKTQKQWGIEYFKITNRPREVTIKALGQNYEVKMYFDEDVQQQVGSWIAVIKKLGEGGETPSEYIDVRVSEKVFWK